MTVLIFESQRAAREQTRKLLFAFALTVTLLVLAVNAALALAWGIGWAFWVPLGAGLPRHFFAVNTGVTLLFVLGGWWLETSRLAQVGGLRLAEQMGARELRPADALDGQRLHNIVHELAIASGLKPPTVMVLARDRGINAFATGWTDDDAVIAVTRGSLEHLTREELQGLVAHELGHLREGDTRLNMRLVGMVFGLEMVYRLGQRLWDPDHHQHRVWIAALVGLALMAAGWLGWVAGHALQAAVARQREYLADARAVQWTRSRDGLGGVLRKVLGIQPLTDEGARRLGSSWQHLLLVSSEAGRVAHWLDSHPTLEQRIRRIYGRPMGPLPLGARAAEDMEAKRAETEAHSGLLLRTVATAEKTGSKWDFSAPVMAAAPGPRGLAGRGDLPPRPSAMGHNRVSLVIPLPAPVPETATALAAATHPLNGSCL